ncbi:MAG: ABC transporter ATP-binding protein [Anaerolineae bacterium]|nr:ABC transporter ATP-binding protein [Anaerolineae bacterium]
MQPLRRALGYLRPYWHITLGAYISLILVTASNLVTPRLIQVIIDNGITARNMRVIVTMTLAILGFAAIRGVFSFLQGYWSEMASQGAAFEMRNALYEKLQKLSFSYHDQSQTGQLMTRATNDVELVRQFTGMGLLQLVNSLIMFFGTAIILFVINWRLALAALALMPVTFLVIFRFVTSVQPIFRQVQEKLGNLNTILQENLSGVRVVKAFAREEYESKRFRHANDELRDMNVQGARAFSFNLPLVFTMSGLGSLIVLWYGGEQVIGGTLTLGELVAFNTYLALLLFPIFGLGMVSALISQAAAGAVRLFEILDAHIEVDDRPGAQPLPPVTGRVAFENVSFRYVGATENTLSHVSFVAEPGQMVAVLGATGAGKSSIINLIPRFYDATSGRVTIDGHDVRDVRVESLRSQIGIVLQETNLFTGSIRDNIAFGRPDARLEDVVEAATAAEAHDFISALPQGYDTSVGERGVGLSGGQKQRIAIARALLLDPRILILDDSTSSVDAETEYRIHQALDRLMQGRTSFVIAQRISTVRNADLILVMEKGRLVATGTHAELLDTSEVYADIYYSQFGGTPTDRLWEENGRQKPGGPPPGDGMRMPTAVATLPRRM